MKSFFELLRHVRHNSIVGADVAISHITYDSRAAGIGSVFVARKGSMVDGHGFIAEAVARGCRAIVCEHLPASFIVPENVSYALVDCAPVALAELSHAFYDFPTRFMTMIGVTGTNGKTSCAVMIKQLLEAHGCVTGLIGTTGSFIGSESLPSDLTTPEAPELCALFDRMRRAGVSHIVMEVSSHALALRRVYGIDFSVAVFTNLTQDHLDFHGTMDAYADAKSLLFESLRHDAVACVWSDDAYARNMLRRCTATIHTIGTRVPEITESSIIHHTISDIACSTEGIAYSVDTMRVTAPLFGAFHVANTALAYIVLSTLGKNVERTVTAMRTLRGAPGRMEIVKVGSIMGIVDYAHTPDALEKTLSSVRDVMSASQKLLVVVGCGGDRDKSKRPIMAAIACAKADELWLTSDNPRTEDPQIILREMLQGISEMPLELRRAHYRAQVDRRSAIEEAVQAAQPGDMVVVAGKGHETYQIIGKQRFPFDDRLVLRSTL